MAPPGHTAQSGHRLRIQHPLSAVGKVPRSQLDEADLGCLVGMTFVPMGTTTGDVGSGFGGYEVNDKADGLI